jgi:hypothetical protein
MSLPSAFVGAGLLHIDQAMGAESLKPVAHAILRPVDRVHRRRPPDRAARSPPRSRAPLSACIDDTGRER